ncbi:F-box protein At5g07610-like [Rhododendron vialii]|uniref:F-box protein At5g07610-like n=1 Tax=Rhododendron vialii TaxID=182163 RepID=UPI00265DB72F|nr:F-box protein At5g07610-like [Rhododendron vialii]
MITDRQLFRITRVSFHDDHQQLAILKFVVLPKLGVVSKSCLWFDEYLIYDPKKSPYYKVVVVSLSFQLGTSRFDVYSSESGSWKSTIATPTIPMLGQGAVWNGAIFLMGCGPGPQSCLKHDHFYFQFDIDAERLSTTGAPCPPYRSKGILYFGECGGHLLLIQIPYGGNATEFKVLEMMDGENKFRWTVKYTVDLKPLALPRRSTYWFTVTSVRNVQGANENDLAVVLCINEGLVVQYNIKCKTLKVLCDLAGGDSPTRIADSHYFIESLTPV